MGMAMAKTSSSSSYNLDSLPPPPPPPETPNLSNPSAASATHPLPCQSPGYSLSDPSSVDDRGKRESRRLAWVAEQERGIKKEITRAIESGNIDSLKPNSRHAITFGEHYVCVYFHDGSDPNYRLWQWHGHVMTGGDNGYMLEYIYGNHYESVTEESWCDEEEDEDLRESRRLAWVAEQESGIEEEITRAIRSGNIDSLKPNSGKAITFGEHSVCVYFHDGSDPNHRSWEWHGHVVTREDNRYKLDYIYGTHSEKVTEEVGATRKKTKILPFPLSSGTGT